jgi:hypothetical protein
MRGFCLRTAIALIASGIVFALGNDVLASDAPQGVDGEVAQNVAAKETPGRGDWRLRFTDRALSTKFNVGSGIDTAAIDPVLHGPIIGASIRF